MNCVHTSERVELPQPTTSRAELDRDGQVNEVRTVLSGRSVYQIRSRRPFGFARSAAHCIVQRLRDLARLGKAVRGLPPALADA